MTESKDTPSYSECPKAATRREEGGHCVAPLNQHTRLGLSLSGCPLQAQGKERETVCGCARACMCVCVCICAPGPVPSQQPGGRGISYRGVFTQLAERGEGFLVSLSDLLCEIVQLSCHFIAFHTFLFRRLFLFLVPVIPDSWK